MIFLHDEMVTLMRDGLHLFRDLRDEIVKTTDAYKTVDPTYSNFATSQFYYYGERCQSVNLLIQDEKLWDCEILSRSALECATRFLFVSVAEREERDRRLSEYWTDLHEVQMLQQSEKSKPAAHAARGSHAGMLLSGATLSPDKEKYLREKWSKAKRAALQQKWSFSEMVRELITVNRDNLDLRLFGNFLHSYSLSSHLIHADNTAVGLLWDRNHREPDVQEAMVRAHAAGMIVDQVGLLFLCWRGLVYATKMQSARKDIVEALQKLSAQAEPFQLAFALTQANFYNPEDRMWQADL